MIPIFLLILIATQRLEAADSCSTIRTTEGDLAPLSIFSTAPSAANTVYRLDTETPTGSDVTTKVQNGRSLNSTANCPADCVFQLITYYANDVTTNEPFDYLYIDPQYVAFVPYPFVRDDSVDPVTCAKVAGYCGATIPIYRYYKFTWNGISHAYSFASDQAIPGYVHERDPLCYIWPQAVPTLTTGGPALNPTQNPSPPDSCGLPLSSEDLVPLKVYDNLQWGPMRDHYYTTHPANSTELFGYVPMDLPMGLVSLTNNSKCGCMVELSQMLDNTTGAFARKDHKLADLKTEKNRIYEFYQPTGEKIYCVSKPSCGAAIPIYKHYQYFDFDSILTNSPDYMMYSYLYPYVPLCYIWNTTLAKPQSIVNEISNTTGLPNIINTSSVSNVTSSIDSTQSTSLTSNPTHNNTASTPLSLSNETQTTSAIATVSAIVSGPPPGAPPTVSTVPTSPTANVTVSAVTEVTGIATNQTILTTGVSQTTGITNAATITTASNLVSSSNNAATTVSSLSLSVTNGSVSVNNVATTASGVSNSFLTTIPPSAAPATDITGTVAFVTNNVANTNSVSVNTVQPNSASNLIGAPPTTGITISPGPFMTTIPPSVAPATGITGPIAFVTNNVANTNSVSVNTVQQNLASNLIGAPPTTGITISPGPFMTTIPPSVAPATGITGPIAFVTNNVANTNSVSVNTVHPNLASNLTGASPVTVVTISPGPNPTVAPTTTIKGNLGITAHFPEAPTFLTINGSQPSLSPQPSVVTSLPLNSTVPPGIFGLPLITVQPTPLPMTAAQMPLMTGPQMETAATTAAVMPMFIGVSSVSTMAPVLPWNIKTLAPLFPVQITEQTLAPSQATELATNQPTVTIPQPTFAPIVIGNFSEQVISTQKPLDILITVGVGLPFAPNVPAAPLTTANGSAGEALPSTVTPPTVLPSMLTLGPILSNGLMNSLNGSLSEQTTVNPLNMLTMFPGQGLAMRDFAKELTNLNNSVGDSNVGSTNAETASIAPTTGINSNLQDQQQIKTK